MGYKTPVGGGFGDRQRLTDNDKAILEANFGPGNEPEFRGSFDKGILEVPQTGIALIHKGEMILPLSIAEMVRQVLDKQAPTFGEAASAVPVAGAAAPASDLVEIARIASGPRELHSGESLGGGGGLLVTFDMRGRDVDGHGRGESEDDEDSRRGHPGEPAHSGRVPRGREEMTLWR